MGGTNGFVVKEDSKLTTEIDISHSPTEIWAEIDLVLLQAHAGTAYSNAIW